MSVAPLQQLFTVAPTAILCLFCELFVRNSKRMSSATDLNFNAVGTERLVVFVSDRVELNVACVCALGLSIVC